MPKTNPPPAPSSAAPTNQILARLPAKDYKRILPRFESVALDLKKVLYEPRSVTEYAYFPTRGVVSMVTLMEDGRGIEVATVGNEGMVGLAIVLGADRAPARFIVQVPGEALRMRANRLREEIRPDGALRALILLYHDAFLKQMSQSVACNGLHEVVQRCCRWLLMTHDRVDGNEFILTHEFLAQMLGVQRSTVTEVLSPLQARGLIRYHRGKVAVLDRRGLEKASCECYRAVRDEFDRLFGDGRE
jgi:CRP-like cAMP-binding protein